MDTPREAYCKEMSALKLRRAQWEPTWRDLGDHIGPNLHEFSQGSLGTLSTTEDGGRKDSLIINSTPPDALDIFQAGLMNGLTDPTEKWAAMRVSNPDANDTHAGREYCEEVTELILLQLAKCKTFYQTAAEDYGAIGCFGNAASLMLEDPSDRVFWFGSLPPGSYYFGNDSRRRVDTLAREFMLTPRQMLQEWPTGNFSPSVRSSMENKTDAAILIGHIIKPNPNWNPTKVGQGIKRWLSCYFEQGTGTNYAGNEAIIEEGFDSFPARTPRWQTKGHDSYGRGPGHKVLGDCRELQALEYKKLLAIDKQLDPPMNAGPGMTLGNLSLMPGAINQTTDPSAQGGLRPVYELKFDLAHAEQLSQAIEQRIRTGFYNNIFLMLANDNGGKMTAREIAERAREKRIALTPILRITSEYLDPTFERAYEIMGRRGLLPAPPPELQGQTLKIEYTSVLAQAAMLENAMGLEHSTSYMLSLAAINSEAMDNINVDELIRTHFRATGTTSKVLRDPKEVEATRQARAQAAQQQQQAEDMAHSADVAKTLSETDTERPSALTQVALAAQQNA